MYMCKMKGKCYKKMKKLIYFENKCYESILELWVNYHSKHPFVTCSYETLCRRIKKGLPINDHIFDKSNKKLKIYNKTCTHKPYYNKSINDEYINGLLLTHRTFY